MIGHHFMLPRAGETGPRAAGGTTGLSDRDPVAGTGVVREQLDALAPPFGFAAGQASEPAGYRRSVSWPIRATGLW